MNDILAFALALVAGALLAAFFFGGLWWTVRKGVASERPAVWFVGSLLLRTSVVLVGFYLVSQGHWSRLLACLLGFLIARAIVVSRLTRPSLAQAIKPDGGSGVRLESLTDGAAVARTPLAKETGIAS